MAGRLDGKVAVVTGAGSGIGEATARLFHAEGAKVVLADVSGNESVVAKSLGDGAVALRTDVSRSEDVQAMLQHALDTFGALDILVNNAGIDGPVRPFAEYAEEDYDRIMSVNAKGVFLGTRHALPIMVERGGGAIVNTSSMAAQVAFPGMNAYCASKGAVMMLTRSAAAEYSGQGVRVNAVCPGPIRTAIADSLPEELINAVVSATPAGRYGEPAEVASLILYLASDEASYITGASMLVDGGYTLV